MTLKYPTARVLVADDEEDLLDLYKDSLSEFVGSVTTALNGKLALELVKSEPFDCIISDISMPEMSGLDFLEAVRELKKPIPFIIVTAFWNKSNAIRALRAGAYDFLEKPLKMEHLMPIVSSALDVGLEMKQLESQMKGLLNSFGDMSQEKRERLILQQQAMATLRNNNK